MIIPAEFEARVLRHFIAASVRDRHPLIMAIQGPPGSGKSFQLWNTLKRSRIVPIHNAAVALSPDPPLITDFGGPASVS